MTAGKCRKCGKFGNDLRDFSYRKKNYGKICKSCRKGLQLIDTYLGDLFKRMENIEEKIMRIEAVWKPLGLIGIILQMKR